MEKKKFFNNFGSIATLGILGTYILFAIIAFCLFAISMLPNLLTFTVSSPDGRHCRPCSHRCQLAALLLQLLHVVCLLQSPVGREIIPAAIERLWFKGSYDRVVK